MPRAPRLPTSEVIRYYGTPESRAFYFILRGVKHFGYYPPGQERLSMAHAQDLMVDKLAECLDPRPGSSILDAGCGEGAAALRLARRYNVQVAGVDILTENIERARRRAERLSGQARVRFAVMDYTRLDFPGHTFDAVYTLESLVHIADYRRALAEFHRVLKPGGRLVLFEYSVPPAHRLTPRQNELSRIVLDGSGMFGLSSFTHGSFPQMLTEAGFLDVRGKDITARVIPSMRSWYRWLVGPYQIVRLLKLQRTFVNTTAVVETYRQLPTQDVWRYNIVTATRP